MGPSTDDRGANVRMYCGGCVDPSLAVVVRINYHFHASVQHCSSQTPDKSRRTSPRPPVGRSVERRTRRHHQTAETPHKVLVYSLAEWASHTTSFMSCSHQPRQKGAENRERERESARGWLRRCHSAHVLLVRPEQTWDGVGRVYGSKVLSVLDAAYMCVYICTLCRIWRQPIHPERDREQTRIRFPYSFYYCSFFFPLPLPPALPSASPFYKVHTYPSHMCICAHMLLRTVTLASSALWIAAAHDDGRGPVPALLLDVLFSPE